MIHWRNGATGPPVGKRGGEGGPLRTIVRLGGALRLALAFARLRKGGGGGDGAVRVGTG